MKTRVIVAGIFVPLIFVVLFFLPPVAVTIFMSAVAVVGSWELIRAAGKDPVKRLYVYTAVSAAIIPVSVLLGSGDVIFRAVLFLLVSIVFGDAVLSYKKEREIKLAQLAAVILGGAVIPYFLSSVVALKLLNDGSLYVLMPFIVAFIADGGAYFTGVYFGKHRAFPSVSPKKTVEGCIGGMMICVAAMVLYGVILYLAAGTAVRFEVLILYGVLGGIVTELGDLAFSLIKRILGIKDYGHLLPGHGGILDRFDSMIFAAPAIHLLVTLMPAF